MEAWVVMTGKATKKLRDNDGRARECEGLGSGLLEIHVGVLEPLPYRRSEPVGFGFPKCNQDLSGNAWLSGVEPWQEPRGALWSPHCETSCHPLSDIGISMAQVG